MHGGLTIEYPTWFKFTHWSAYALAVSVSLSLSLCLSLSLSPTPTPTTAQNRMYVCVCVGRVGEGGVEGEMGVGG